MPMLNLFIELDIDATDKHLARQKLIDALDTIKERATLDIPEPKVQEQVNVKTHPFESVKGTYQMINMEATK